MTNETVFDVDYFIRKFSAIPENQWCIHNQTDDRGRHCAYGHCQRNADEYMSFSNLDKQYSGLIGGAYLGRNKGNGLLAEINNGHYADYQQPTPKQRILAALRDIKAMQQPSYPDITKSLAILPTEEVADRKIQTVKG